MSKVRIKHLKTPAAKKTENIEITTSLSPAE
jgi:hypothetical protein